MQQLAEEIAFSNVQVALRDADEATQTDLRILERAVFRSREEGTIPFDSYAKEIMTQMLYDFEVPLAAMNDEDMSAIAMKAYTMSAHMIKARQHVLQNNLLIP